MPILLVRAFAWAALMALTGCSSPKKSPEPTTPKVDGDALPVTPPAANKPVSPLMGTWKTSDCATVAAGGWSKDLMVFQDGVVIAARNFYSDAKCETMTYTATLQGKYTAGDANAAGGTNLDLLYSQHTATYPSRDATTKALATYVSGPTAICTSASAPVVSGTIIDLTACAKDPGALFQYTVYTVTSSELHLAVPGSDATSSGKGASTRATKMDGALVYTKQ